MTRIKLREGKSSEKQIIREYLHSYAGSLYDCLVQFVSNCRGTHQNYPWHSVGDIEIPDLMKWFYGTPVSGKEFTRLLNDVTTAVGGGLLINFNREYSDEPQTYELYSERFETDEEFEERQARLAVNRKKRQASNKKRREENKKKKEAEEKALLAKLKSKYEKK